MQSIVNTNGASNYADTGNLGCTKSERQITLSCEFNYSSIIKF